MVHPSIMDTMLTFTRNLIPYLDMGFPCDERNQEYTIHCSIA
jgi:hypothetical protein